jgi:sugar phosphate permease
MVTGRITSKTGLTMIFPSIGLIFATATLIILAFAVGSLTATQLALVLFLNGLFMGTVMGVVQVTVQSAAGPQSLGAAAASVQLSRSIGAAMGTALVGTVLFAALALGDPQAAQVFARAVERAVMSRDAVAPIGSEAIRAEIAAAFRASFLTIAAFAAIGLALAWTIPSRRL